MLEACCPQTTSGWRVTATGSRRLLSTLALSLDGSASGPRRRTQIWCPRPSKATTTQPTMAQQVRARVVAAHTLVAKAKVCRRARAKARDIIEHFSSLPAWPGLAAHCVAPSARRSRLRDSSFNPTSRELDVSPTEVSEAHSTPSVQLID